MLAKHEPCSPPPLPLTCSPSPKEVSEFNDTKPAISTKISTPSTGSTDSTNVIAVDPAASFVVISEADVQMEPVNESFDCIHPCIHCPIHCPLTSARKNNLKTHIGTRDKEAYPYSLAGDYSTPMRQLESVGPAAPSVHAILESDKREKPFKCPHCVYSSARKYNFKAHMETHNGSLSGFKCDTCGRRFSRKHDLRRHCETIHRHTTTSSGDGRLMSSLHPGSFSDTGFEDLVASWENVTWLQGV